MPRGVKLTDKEREDELTKMKKRQPMFEAQQRQSQKDEIHKAALIRMGDLLVDKLGNYKKDKLHIFDTLKSGKTLI